MSGYRKHPPEGPSRRTISLLTWTTLAVLIAAIAQKAGVG